MGKYFKYFLKIVLFPITLLFWFFKLIWKLFEKGKTLRYIENISIEQLDALDGYGLEDFLYAYFSSLGFKVDKTQKSRDYGADLIVHNRGKKIVIQCKLYFNHSVGNSAIQEIATAKDYYLADKCVVITNSYFTKSAITLSISAGVTLIDRNGLNKLLTVEKGEKKYLVNNYFGCE